jgi:hypothetical protein
MDSNAVAQPVNYSGKNASLNLGATSFAFESEAVLFRVRKEADDGT